MTNNTKKKKDTLLSKSLFIYQTIVQSLCLLQTFTSYLCIYSKYSSYLTITTLLAIGDKIQILDFGDTHLDSGSLDL